jgi:hypothetical protein
MKPPRRLLPALLLALLVPGSGFVRLSAGPPPAPVSAVEGYELVGFDQLASFTFNPPGYDAAAPEAKPAPKQDDQIPERIRHYNEKKVAVTGFMLPVKMDGGLVKEFLLVKDPMLCCYGVMPKLNEWVVVKMTGAGVKPLMDVPITFEGRLKVGEMFENGYLTGIYLLEGERMAETKG